jgi:Mrp family chromosome partitioning ATPase
LIAAGFVVIGAEAVDGRLKTVADVERVTGLPVLASVGDLKSMSPAEQEAWAFRTWTAIAGQLNSSPNRGMVCGFISSSSGEGCSTWVNLLVNAANKRGLRAGVMAARNVGPVGTESDSSEQVQTTDGSGTLLPAAVNVAAEGLMAPVRAHIPLPGSVWSLEHRKEWQNTLGRWRNMENLVVLVDLPPASVSEAVLLAENIPQVIWLADSGKARARATREQLKTLRHAKCRVVGAVLNHEPKPVFELDL